MKILLVDDQERILKAMEKLVAWKKLEVTQVYTADSAAAAKKIMSESPVDIMLTDIEMPGEDGISLQNMPDAASWGKWMVRKDSVEELVRGVDFCIRQYHAILSEKEGKRIPIRRRNGFRIFCIIWRRIWTG